MVGEPVKRVKLCEDCPEPDEAEKQRQLEVAQRAIDRVNRRGLNPDAIYVDEVPGWALNDGVPLHPFPEKESAQ